MLVLDVTEEEADKILMTHDPIALLATTNQEMLAELQGLVSFDDADLRSLTHGLAEGYLGPDGGKTRAEQAAEKEMNEGKIIPEMELRPDEHYDYVLVLARNRLDWNRLVEIFDLQKERKPGSDSQIGLGRAIDARVLLEKLGR